MGSGLFFRGAEGTDWTVSGSEPWVSVEPLCMGLQVLGVSVVGGAHSSQPPDSCPRGRPDGRVSPLAAGWIMQRPVWEVGVPLRAGPGGHPEWFAALLMPEELRAGEALCSSPGPGAGPRFLRMLLALS